MSNHPGGYPKQYPQGGGYPQQHYQGTAPPPMQPYPRAPYPQQQGYVPINQPMQPPAYGVPPPPYTTSPHQPPPAYPTQQMQPRQQVVMPAAQGSFDAGARFYQGMPPSIPPPPPGCPPTGAQVAAAHGQPVVMGQNRSDWISGGSDGGYTVW